MSTRRSSRLLDGTPERCCVFPRDRTPGPVFSERPFRCFSNTASGRTRNAKLNRKLDVAGRVDELAEPVIVGPWRTRFLLHTPSWLPGRSWQAGDRGRRRSWQAIRCGENSRRIRRQAVMYSRDLPQADPVVAAASLLGRASRRTLTYPSFSATQGAVVRPDDLGATCFAGATARRWRSQKPN